ncbi:hypothetical protein [Nocardia tengchongensis]
MSGIIADFRPHYRLATCDGSQHRGEHYLVESVLLALTESGAMTEDQLRTVKDALLKRFPRAASTRTLPHDIAADAIEGILPAATMRHIEITGPCPWSPEARAVLCPRPAGRRRGRPSLP